MGVQYCNLTYIPSGISLGVVFLDHLTVLLLVFWGASVQFPIMIALIYIPTSHEGSFLSHLCQHLLLFLFLMVAILIGVRWNLNLVLICISIMAKDGEPFIICFFRHLDFFLWKASFQLICPFLHWVIDILGALFFVYTGYQFLVWYIASKDFSHSVGVLFNLETISFVVQKVFNFM
jgi:hypothetical protein